VFLLPQVEDPFHIVTRLHIGLLVASLITIIL
jgi:hypothetical protein